MKLLKLIELRLAPLLREDIKKQQIQDSARMKLKIWLKSNHPRALTGNDEDLINTRSIILPLDRDITLSFLEQAQRLRLRGDILEEMPQDQPPIAVRIR